MRGDLIQPKNYNEEEHTKYCIHKFHTARLIPEFICVCGDNPPQLCPIELAQEKVKKYHGPI